MKPPSAPSTTISTPNLKPKEKALRPTVHRRGRRRHRKPAGQPQRNPGFSRCHGQRPCLRPERLATPCCPWHSATDRAGRFIGESDAGQRQYTTLTTPRAEARKIAPTQFLVGYKINAHRRSLWEQSLLAISVGLLALMLNVPPSSRASPLPQWDRSTTAEPGQLSGRLASKLCSHRTCSNRSDGRTTRRIRSATRPPRGGR